jgi:hypothetical protein
MDIFTVNRSYQALDIIDDFTSVIWTERYYGDSEFELSLPMRRKTLERLPPGILIGCSKSDELMVVEEGTINGGSITYKGIGILPWLNNRFVRYSPIQSQTSIDSGPLSNVGSAMWDIVSLGATEESPALNADWALYGVPFGYGERLKIPGLGLRDFDSVPNSAEGTFSFSKEFGPVYDGVRKLAEAYEIGCKIDWKPGFVPLLGFRAYRGVDRTSRQREFPVIRFSPLLDTLTDITELFSKAKYKNLAFSYSTNAPLDYTIPGIASTEEASEASGFDLRAALVFIDNMEDGPLTYDVITDALSGDARNFLGQNRYIRAIDGQIIPSPLIRYGRDYSLGDLVEEQGETGAVSFGRVMEFIRAQDKNGYREYPTISETESVNTTLGYFAPAPEAIPDPPPDPDPPPPDPPPPPTSLHFSTHTPSGTSPSPKDEHAICNAGLGKIFLMDGVLAPSGSAASNQFALYDEDTNSFTIHTRAGGDPIWRQEQDVVFDGLGILLFGGQSTGAFGPARNDTWRLNLSTWVWTQLYADGASGIPSRRKAMSLCYDSLNNRVLLHGGRTDSTGPFSDTWAMTPGTNVWSLVTSGGPPRRSGTFFADNLGNAYYFGGYNGSAFVNTVWKLTGSTWTDVTPGTIPLADIFECWGFDVASGLFYGWDRHHFCTFDGTNFALSTVFAGAATDDPVSTRRHIYTVCGYSGADNGDVDNPTTDTNGYTNLLTQVQETPLGIPFDLATRL